MLSMMRIIHDTRTIETKERGVNKTILEIVVLKNCNFMLEITATLNTKELF